MYHNSIACVPRTNSANVVVRCEEKQSKKRPMPYSNSKSQPVHILLNMALSTLNRYNKPLKPSSTQRHFIDRMACSLFSVCFPILYYAAMLFPRHYWIGAEFEKEAILGCAPISCYSGKGSHPNGFASHIERARNHAFLSSSSTSTCSIYISHLYDVQCNVAMANYDSRTVMKAGFKVDNKSTTGFKLGEHDESELNESTDTAKGLMGLAASSVRHSMDLFVTYTCNQSTHPGICHLYKFKESNEWLKNFPLYNKIRSSDEISDVKNSFEMAYTHVLSRCWMEVQKIWINLLMMTTSSMLPKVKFAFFRKEFQHDIGNLSHIHALLSLDRESMGNKEFMQFLCDLQKNSVIDLMDPDLFEPFMTEGLVRDRTDWKSLHKLASTVLPHKCSNGRCLIRTGPGPNDFVCKKIDATKGRALTTENSWIPIPVKFSEKTLQILERTGHYKSPDENELEGGFTSDKFKPCRHVGRVNPTATCNMSPVLGQHFAFTRSMQNMQIICGTNAVTRYIVKVS